MSVEANNQPLSNKSQSGRDLTISGNEDLRMNLVNTTEGTTSIDQSHTIVYNYYYQEHTITTSTKEDENDNLICPYQGLYHFYPEKSEYFFGREVFVEELYQYTETRNFIPVLGASGSGKSSVILAGLVPKLVKAGHWQFTHFRPGNDPFHALAQALVPLYAPNLNETKLIGQARELAGYFQDNTVPLSDVLATIQRNHPNNRVLLIADQFEEIYTLCNDEKIRRQFLDTLLNTFKTFAEQSSLSTVLVGTMRADFLGNALSYRPLADVLQHANIMLGPMNETELRDVIEKPAQKLEVSFESGLVERILDDVDKEPGNLPLLEFALTELWKKRKGKQLTHDVYQEIGEVSGAITRYADQKFSNLKPEEKEQVRRIFVQLVRPGAGTEDTRRVATKAELSESNWKLVKKLADQRLVVTSRTVITREIIDNSEQQSENLQENITEQEEQETVEVVHEALIQNWGQLRDWMETDREFRVWQDRLRGSLKQWENAQRDEGALLRGVPLSEAEDMLQARRDDLSRSEQKFIEQSLAIAQRQAQKEKRRVVVLGSLLAVASTVAVIAIGAGLFARQQSQLAEKQKVLAISQYSQELFNRNEDKIESLVQGIRAAKMLKQTGNDPDAETQARIALQQAVYGVSERNRLQGHGGSVQAVTISPDGEAIATAGRDNTIMLWQMSGAEIATLNGHQDVVWEISFSPDGQTLASASRDGTVRLWDLEEREERQVFQGHRDDVYSVSFSPDGRTLASAGQDGTVKLWNVENPGAAPKTLSGHNGPVNRVAFSPNGQTLASAGQDGTVKLWNLQATNQAPKTLSGHQNGVYAIGFNPKNSDELVSADGTGTIKLWTGDGQEIRTIKGHTATIWDVSFSPDGQSIASVGRSNEVKIWNRESGELKSLNGHEANGDVWSLSFNPQDSSMLATAGRDATVKLWTLNRQITSIDEDIHIVSGHGGGLVEEAEFDSKNQFIASAGWDNTIHLWTVEGQEVKRQILEGHNDDVWDVSFNPKASLLASTGRDKSIKLWTLEGEEIYSVQGHNDGIETVEFSPDGQTLASASWDNTVKLWRLDGNKLKLQKTLEGHTAAVESVAFNLNATSDRNTPMLVTASWDKTAKLWDSDGNELVTLQGHKAAVESASFSPDGQTIVTTSWDNTVKLWNLKGEELQTLTDHSSWVRDASFSSDGNLLATASNDQTVLLWEKRGEKFHLLQTIWVHGSFVNSVNFSSDDQYLVSSDSSGNLIVGSVDLDLTIDKLLEKGCSWARDYLQNNPYVSPEDRQLCQ